MSQDVVSFVLRFIREGGDNEPARWRGVIKHVQSDSTNDFARFSDALQFMQDHVNEAIRQSFAGNEPLSPDKMMAETARLWGEMAPRYTDIMLQSMELMLEQGRRVTESLAENLANRSLGMQQTTQDHQGQLLALIERLSQQVDSLTGKVDELEARLGDE